MNVNAKFNVYRMLSPSTYSYLFQDISQRAAQERPRTAKAARGFMRGSRAAIGADDVLAARRAVLEKLKTEIKGTTSS